jgi:HemY protein
VLEIRCATGDWAGALHLLERNRSTLDKASYRRQRAVLLTARAQSVEDTDRDSAKNFALEAHKLAPTLVPAAALAGRLLAEGGQQRKASRVIDKAWRANPHPELAQAHTELRSGDSALDRLKRIEALAKKVPGHVEGALATARAALHAQEFAKARAALAAYLQTPTKRIALLMAELERAEKNDEGRAREWVARALNAAPDAAWTADGYVSDRWLPASPLTGTLGAPVIEPEPLAAAPVEIVAGTRRESETAAAEVTSAATIEIPRSRRTAGQTPSKPDIKPEPVIPLVHAPDDPGPDVHEEIDAPVEPQTGSWRKIFE